MSHKPTPESAQPSGIMTDNPTMPNQSMELPSKYLTPKQRIIMLNWRPFKGAFLPSKSTAKSLFKKDNDKDTERNLRYGRELDTSGLDTFLALIRALAAFGWGFLEFESENELKLTLAAIGPLGAKGFADRDRDIKGKLLMSLYPDISLEDFEEKPKTFRDLMERLPAIITKNPEFLLCRFTVCKPIGGQVVARGLSKEDLIYAIQWDSKWDNLETYIGEQCCPPWLDPTKELKDEPVWDKASWIRVERRGPFHIKSARRFDMTGRFSTRTPGKYRIRYLEYKLLAVVRHANKTTGVQDRIRIYDPDYSEIRSKFQASETDDSVRQPKGWSTSQDADYSLYYFKVLEPERSRHAESKWPEHRLKENALEYEDLDCHGREIEMEQPQASQFASSPGSGSGILSSNNRGIGITWTPPQDDSRSIGRHGGASGQKQPSRAPTTGANITPVVNPRQRGHGEMDSEETLAVDDAALPLGLRSRLNHLMEEKPTKIKPQFTAPKFDALLARPSNTITIIKDSLKRNNCEHLEPWIVERVAGNVDAEMPLPKSHQHQTHQRVKEKMDRLCEYWIKGQGDKWNEVEYTTFMEDWVIVIGLIPPWEKKEDNIW